ncbi:uncharacterized protein EDB91DRAFT_1116277 [Suillus paluster]|uniref:uncharacterized protein n=1 Tax=Suillus paluster TaxID=48578 RepID=UPI001B88114C|nr:uncharacterized protein EDB91DRAFT_1116277 [Suillus paluster]KAG1747099.1 hypothetical protein EDB91DRAFT_1116277 [Suillus paluster]
MDLHKRLRSALWRLPTELLFHIFYLSPTSKLAPMLLTRICRRWREVAVGMPSLWCMLYMQLDDSDSMQRAGCYYGSSDREGFRSR